MIIIAIKIVFSVIIVFWGSLFSNCSIIYLQTLFQSLRPLVFKIPYRPPYGSLSNGTLYCRRPKVGNPIASILKRNV